MIIRPLEKKDIKNGFYDTLKSVWPNKVTCDVEDFEHYFSAIEWQANILVAIINDKVVGTGSIYQQWKFLRTTKSSHGVSGHIEEIAIHKDYQGQGIGKKIVERLIEDAYEMGCYKISLNCDDEIVGFYQGLGFKKVANEMKMYLKE